MPPLSQEVLVRLPKYCPQPTKRNLATQYFFWNKELLKENGQLVKKNKELEQKLGKAQKEIAQLEEKARKLELEKEKLKRLLFKSRRQKISVTVRKPKPRTKESYLRPLPTRIDEEKEALLSCCPHCQGELSKKIDSYNRIIEDLPPPQELKVRVTKYTINRYYCRKCKKIVSARPKEVLPKTRLGPNVLLRVLYSKYRLRLSEGLIKEDLKNSFGLKVSTGEINNLLVTGSLVFQNKWQEIVETIKDSKTVHADETSWRVDGDSHWLWAFTNKQVTRYTITKSRGKGVPQDVLGENYSGTVISDFYPVYNQFTNKQRCWVHLLRKAKELAVQEPGKTRKEFYHHLKEIHQEILSFRIQQTSGKQKQAKAQEIKEKLISLSQQRTKDQELAKLLCRINKYAGELIVCITNREVSPDNNKAERTLRGPVLLRKISGGSRSKQGALTTAVNLSVIETLRKEKQNLLEGMGSLILGYVASIG